MKAKAQLIIGMVSLVALLAYTLAHTGALLAQYVKPAVIGYVAALGIELSIVSLSLRIGELRQTRQRATFFYFVLVSVVVVSAVANIAEGFHTLYLEHLTLSNVSKLDLLQAVIGVTATGLISLIVLALSEILGTDVNISLKMLEKAALQSTRVAVQKVSLTEKKVTESAPIEKARDAKVLQDAAAKDERYRVIVTALGDNPATEVTELAELTGVSRQTIYRDISTLVSSGSLEKNGNGWKVTQ